MAGVHMCKTPLRTLLFSPLSCRRILSLRTRSCSTKTEEQRKEGKQEFCSGINYLKEGTDPPLLPDHEYPDWLWKLAEPSKSTTDEQSQTYWRTLNKKQRRQENEIRKQKKL